MNGKQLQFLLSTLLGEVLQELKCCDPNKQSNLFAVYVNFDREGIIHEYVAGQVRELALAGYRVVFVTQSPKLRRGHEQITPICTKFIHRRNINHDFGGYGFGLRLVKALSREPAAVVLMNDSCYGFFRPVTDLNRQVTEGHADLWGITESYEHAYHLQSYFLIISGRLFASPCFWKYWSRFCLHTDRDHVIEKGEIGLTQHVLASGFKVRSLVSYEDLVEYWLTVRCKNYGNSEKEIEFVTNLEHLLGCRLPVNPTHYFWDILLEQFNAPLLKRDLIRRNPVAIPGIQKFIALINKLGADYSAIEDHLRYYKR
ncbi:MAG: rhamnan synthesis F family protein [Syntrophobacter sp.]